MSQSYRVSLVIEESVRADDQSVVRLELRPIIERDEMIELLAGELEGLGFERDDASMRRERDGLLIEVDLETLEARASVGIEREVRGQIDAWGEAESRSGARRSAEASATRQANRLMEQGARRARAEAARALEGSEESRRAELGGAIERVYAEALKRKAARLGEVIEVREGVSEGGEYELVIKVEV